ncbi:hypothetical protein CONLIGDRAFT_584386, partial [Coniochaeta ligniaria NRRL 30616]
KHCEPSVTVRKRNGRRQAASRTAQLEEKLEDLVTLLRSQSTAVKPPAASHTAPDTTHGSSHLDLWANTPAPSHTGTAPAGSSDDQSDSNPAARTTTGGPQTPAAILGAAFSRGLFNHWAEPVPISSMIQAPGLPATLSEAEEQLALFREQYLQCFPCIYIPSNMTSDQLRDEKPFTWFTIMMMSCQTSSLQYGMGSVWQRIISQKIVVEHEKSIDILQGMIIFLAWSQYHKKDRPYLAVFTQIALSQVYDLGLNKLPGDPTAFACFKPNAFNPYLVHKERTMEDRRTVLACFYISSQIAFTLKKMEGLRWTAHMNDCLNFLNEHPEWPGDQVLAAQVRVHLLIDQLGSDGSAAMPPYYNLTALASPIDAVKIQLPPGLETNDMIRIQLLYSELAVLENSLCRTPYNPKKPDLRRYEILSRIVDTLKRWFDMFFPLSNAHYTALSLAFWCQLAHTIMSLYKISTLDEPAWDRAALRRDIDVLDICDRVIHDMNAASAHRRQIRPEIAATTPSQCAADNDIFSVCGRMIVAMRNGWALELGAPQMDPTGLAADGPPDDNGFVDNITTGPMAVPINFLDDAWLTDVFNISWE